MKRVLVLGTFDLLHPGHVRFLELARRHGDELWVALNSDAFVQRYKRPPIMTYDERARMLKALRVVDNVFPNFGAEDSKPAIVYANKSLDGLVIVHGDDWTGDSYMEQLRVNQGWLRARDIEIVYVPYTAGVSTTDILRRIRGTDLPYCDCAITCLGQAILDEEHELLHRPATQCRRA